MRLALAAVLLAACTDNTVVVVPVIDLPVNDTAQATALDAKADAIVSDRTRRRSC